MIVVILNVLLLSLWCKIQFLSHNVVVVLGKADQSGFTLTVSLYKNTLPSVLTTSRLNIQYPVSPPKDILPALLASAVQSDLLLDGLYIYCPSNTMGL